MEGMRGPGEIVGRIAATSAGIQTENLRRTAYGEVPLGAAFLTLSHWQEEQERVAADLLERETWALTTILGAAGQIWSCLPSPTMQFILDRRAEPSGYHLELGTFGHLTTLTVPTAGEQALIAATTPCWARVYPHQQRLLAGERGAAACSYVPISVAEAVAALGFERILTQLEAATRVAGQGMLARAQIQREQEARLVTVERGLGWDSDPPAETTNRPAATRARLAAHLGRDQWSGAAVGAALVGIAGVMLWVFIGIVLAGLTLILAGSCL